MTANRVATTRRPALLAGALVATAGLVDVLSALAVLTTEPYVVMTDEAIIHLHTSGWVSLHLVIGLSTVAAGLLIMLDRPWTAPVGLGAVLVGTAVDLVFIPYDPFRAMMAIGFEVAAVVVLARHGRLRIHLPH